MKIIRKKKFIFVILIIVLLIGIFIYKKIYNKTLDNLDTINLIENNVTNENINLSCEVKFLLNPNIVLNENKELKDNYKNIFFITKKPKINSVIYIDTANFDFYNAGWVNRLRLKDGKDDYNITYKKRYKVNDEDIESTLIKVKNDGFVDVEAELDWGYNNMTLSISYEQNVLIDDNENKILPTRDKAITYINDYMPAIEDDNGWGKSLLKNANTTSPIDYKKYSGNFDEQSISIEVWSFYNKSVDKKEYIVELSFKANLEDARKLRQQIMDYLDELSILLHEDSLKTQKVLNVN